jgi:UDP-2-acetamido-2-deoxy-ribo-hexuluronate aminotransferase
MKINFIDLQAQYQEYKSEIDSEIQKVLDSSGYIGGPQLSQLSETLATYTGAKYCLPVSSGTDALVVALMAYDIGAGDEVITTPFTFIATAEVISFLGATPVFVDIDEKTYNIDPSKIEAAITSKTKAIMPVALYGQPVDMDEINAIAKKYNLPVIEDVCQSFGVEYKGVKSCNLSEIGCTSFFPSKPLGCYGDGGAIFTSDDALYEKMKSIANHGQGERYVHQYIGLNGRLDAIQAAVLNVKMRYFAGEVTKRQEIGQVYSTKLADAELITPEIKSDRTTPYAQYSVRTKDRAGLSKKLNEAGIPTAVHYPIPLYKQVAYKNLNINPNDFPISEKISEEIMSLPMSPYLSQEDQDFIVNTIKGS